MQPLGVFMGDDEEAWADPFAVVLFDRLAGFLVVTDGARERAVRVPGGEWIVLATGERLTGPLSTSLPAPLGAPPLLLRAGQALVLDRTSDTLLETTVPGLLRGCCQQHTASEQEEQRDDGDDHRAPAGSTAGQRVRTVARRRRAGCHRNHTVNGGLARALALRRVGAPSAVGTARAEGMGNPTTQRENVMKSAPASVLVFAALLSSLAACGTEDQLDVRADDEQALVVIEEEEAAPVEGDGAIPNQIAADVDADLAEASGCTCTRKTVDGTTTFRTSMDNATQDKCDAFAKRKTNKSQVVTCVVNPF
jgi:predicted small lipoprotein YifL